MKSANEWFRDLVHGGPIMLGRSWIRAIQADAIEAAAKECESDGIDGVTGEFAKAQCVGAIRKLKERL